jgi:hypothetical protein
MKDDDQAKAKRKEPQPKATDTPAEKAKPIPDGEAIADVGDAIGGPA